MLSQPKQSKDNIRAKLSKLYDHEVLFIPKNQVTSKISKSKINQLKIEHSKNMKKKQRQLRLQIKKAQILQYKQQFWNEPFNHKRKLFYFPVYKSNPFQNFYDLHTFPNQKQFGLQISNQFANNLNLLKILAVAPTQSGKTGSMLSTIYHFLNNPILSLPINNIFIFTAHSSREWLLQTKSRFPSILSNNILHRNQLKQLIHKLTNLQNVLLIIDEAHIGSKFNQTLHKLYKSINLYNFHKSFQSNIKILSFTATPNDILNDELLWKSSSTVLHMDVPNNYISHQYLLHNNRLFQYHDLTGFNILDNTVDPAVFDNIKQLIPIIQNLPPKYHIIRTPRAKAHSICIQNFKLVFSKQNFRFLSYSQIHNLDKLLSIQPKTHTFIFIKDILRCAKTINKQFIGILYERFTSYPSQSSIIQGLAGRATGFYNSIDIPFVFTHLKSIHNLP